MSFLGHELSLMDHCPPELCRRKGWNLALASLPPLSRFLTLSMTQFFVKEQALDFSSGTVDVTIPRCFPLRTMIFHCRSSLGYRFGVPP